MRVGATRARGKAGAPAGGVRDTLPKRAGRIISKAVKSAAANAEERSGGDVSVEDLKIAAITVDGGPINKRWMPRSMGRANRINNRTSHLTVVVSDE